MRNWFNSPKFKVFAVLSILALVGLAGVVIAQTLATYDPNNSNNHDSLTDAINRSSDYLLINEQDDDAPLEILESKVKEISAPDYQKLTGSTTNAEKVISVPQVKLLNVSEKTVNRVLLIISNPAESKSHGLTMRNLSIAPGQTLTIVRENFVRGYANADENRASITNPMKSQKFWLPFSDKGQLRVRIGVEFEDGTKWYNDNQRGEADEK